MVKYTYGTLTEKIYAEEETEVLEEQYLQDDGQETDDIEDGMGDDEPVSDENREGMIRFLGFDVPEEIFHRLSREEELGMIKEYQEASKNGQQDRMKEIKNSFLPHYYMYIYRIAGKCANTGVIGFDEAFQEGCLGAMRAMDAFDPEEGTRFLTLADYWIRQGIQRCIENTEASIRLPSHSYRAYGLYRRIEHPERYTMEQLAEMCGTTVSTMSHVASYRDSMSYNMKAGVEDDDESELLDFIDSGETVEKDIVDSIASEELLAFIKGALKEREYDIICRRVLKEQTLEEIAGEYGMTRERVRQIQNKALAKVRMKLCITEFGKRAYPEYVGKYMTEKAKCTGMEGLYDSWKLRKH